MSCPNPHMILYWKTLVIISRDTLDFDTEYRSRTFASISIEKQLKCALFASTSTTALVQGREGSLFSYLVPLGDLKPPPCNLSCSPFWKSGIEPGQKMGVCPHGAQGFNRSSPNTQGLPMTAFESCGQDLSSVLGLFSFIVFNLAPVNYKLALAKSICQRPNNKNRGICHLPQWRLSPVLP